MLQRARAALLWEHLAPWLFVYADTARRIAAPFYRRWAELLLEALACAVADCGTLEHVPVHLDALPPMPDPQEAGAEEYLAALLAPARSGVVLTRADCAERRRRSGWVCARVSGAIFCARCWAKTEMLRCSGSQARRR